MIGTMVAFRHSSMRDLTVVLAWGTVLGCVLQFAVQMPLVLRLTRNLRWRPEMHSAHVREVLKNFLPVAVSRGVVQISAYVDQSLASLVSRAAHVAAVAAMGNAQSIYMLPVSLFGMAISAAELPAMSGTLGTDAEVQAGLRRRLNAGLRRIAFLIVPSAMAFFALGDVITAALYEHGKFTHANSVYVWGIIAGSGIGLLASTLGRLYASTYYALRDTRTPLKYASLRVALTVSLGYVCALPLPRWLGIGPQWGAAGRLRSPARPQPLLLSGFHAFAFGHCEAGRAIRHVRRRSHGHRESARRGGIHAGGKTGRHQTRSWRRDQPGPKAIAALRGISAGLRQSQPPPLPPRGGNGGQRRRSFRW